MSSRPVLSLLVASSIGVIERSQSPTGAYVAAPEYGTYEYSWIRDGAFIAAAMDAHGRHDSADAFHRWVAGTVERHADKIRNVEAAPKGPFDESQVLHTRFTTNGQEGTERWGNFQLDGYGFWLTSVARHITTTSTDPEPYRGAIDLVCRYLTLTWKRPCFDCWEEYPTRRHMTTWAAVAKGLCDSGRLLDDGGAIGVSQDIVKHLTDHIGSDGTLLKFVPQSEAEDHAEEISQPTTKAVAGHERIGRSLHPNAIDGSALLVLGSFGPFPLDDPIVARTLRAIEETLVVEGGVHRYLEDEYYGGGLWIVLAGALASAQSRENPKRAKQILDWIEAQADAVGHLGEQSSTHLRKPESREPWVERWGPPAKPLLWSHAMYLLGEATVRQCTVAPTEQ